MFALVLEVESFLDLGWDWKGAPFSYLAMIILRARGELSRTKADTEVHVVELELVLADLWTQFRSGISLES